MTLRKLLSKYRAVHSFFVFKTNGKKEKNVFLFKCHLKFKKILKRSTLLYGEIELVAKSMELTYLLKLALQPYIGFGLLQHLSPIGPIPRQHSPIAYFQHF